VQDEDDPLRLAVEVVAEKGPGPQVAPALEEDVVEDVIDVDQEAAAARPATSSALPVPA